VTDYINNPCLETDLATPHAPPLVAILLCTYNGASFLAEQLDSLESQDHENWFVVASDDGSTDQTLEILQEYQLKWSVGKLVIRGGPQKGFCHNFLSLSCDPKILAHFYAFCDQDDVWLPNKLTVALKKIGENQKPNEPYVYCGRTIYVDEKLKKVGCSRQFSFPRTFRNAIVQSIAGGNTMVFNQKTKEYLEKAGPVNHPSHDWWLYQLVTAVGGEVFYDPEPQVLYRQHEDTLVGGNSTLVSKMDRISMGFRGQFKNWSDTNIAAICSVYPLLNHDSKKTFELFKKMRNARFRDRLRLLKLAALYRQTWFGTICLQIAVLLKKI